MAEIFLPESIKQLRPRLGGLVDGIESRLPYGAVLLSAREGLQIQVENREENVIVMPPTAGTVLTAFDGHTLHERSIGGFEWGDIERSARQLSTSLKANGRFKIEPGQERSGDFITPMEIPPESLSTMEKLERCRDIHRRLKDRDPRIVNAVVWYLERNEFSVFRNRAADLAQRVQRIRLFLMVAVSGEKGVRYNWTTVSGTGGWEKIDVSDETLQNLVDKTIALMDAGRIEPGEYTVISGPGVTGTICHESFGHGVETDMFVKERARAARFIDQRVGSDLVNIWEDPSLPGAFGQYYFDDEGVLSNPTQIVENGIFRRGITDMFSASLLGIPRSANGRRQDFTRKAYARMSTTVFGKGATPVADLFSQVENGIYLEKWSSGMEDPKGWGIQVTCHYGEEIKNGKLTGRLFAPVGISGYVPDVLQSVSGVGDQFLVEGGTCGKGHKEWVPVSSGGPHILFKARLG